MIKRELIDFCLSFSSVYEDYPFDETTAILRHSGNKKMFAAINEARTGTLYISLKCEPMKADFYRRVYKSVEPAWHFNKVHWNGVTVNGDVPLDELYAMIQHSFELTRPRAR